MSNYGGRTYETAPDGRILYYGQDIWMFKPWVPIWLQIKLSTEPSGRARKILVSLLAKRGRIGLVQVNRGDMGDLP